MTLEPFREISALSPVPGSVCESAESASQTDRAIRFDLAERTRLASQFFKVNVVGARSYLKVALGTVPDSRGHSAKSLRPA